MNKKESRVPWLQLAFAFLVFVIVLVLGFIYRDTLRETVLDSLLYVLWAWDITIKSSDQRLIWLLALLITLLIVSISSRQKSEKPKESPRQPLESHPPETRRIPFWRSRIKIRESVIRRPGYFRPELNWLAIKTLVFHQNSTVKDVKDRLRSRELIVPPEVLEILGMDTTESELDQNAGIIQRILQWFSERFKVPRYIPDPRLEKVAAYLESLLEDSYDS
ncbi:MAG: hypothetical protein ABFS17_07585 [Chloroflexota bacterium]